VRKISPSTGIRSPDMGQTVVTPLHLANAVVISNCALQPGSVAFNLLTADKPFELPLSDETSLGSKQRRNPHAFLEVILFTVAAKGGEGGGEGMKEIADIWNEIRTSCVSCLLGNYPDQSSVVCFSPSRQTLVHRYCLVMLAFFRLFRVASLELKAASICMINLCATISKYQKHTYTSCRAIVQSSV
jgi:hypothetical protein